MASFEVFEESWPYYGVATLMSRKCPECGESGTTAHLPGCAYSNLYRFTFRPGRCEDLATGRPVPVDVRLAKLLKYAAVVGLRTVDMAIIEVPTREQTPEAPAGASNC